MNISLFLQLEPHISGGMSDFQMSNFVINDNITPYRKLRQAVIEAKARLENITYFGFDLEELEIKKENAIHLTSTCDVRQLKLNELEIRRHTFEIDRKKTLLDQMKKEAVFFLTTIDTLVNTEFDGELSIIAKISSSRFQEDEESSFWVQKLSRSVFSDYVNYGTVSKGVLESIACLSTEQQAAIMSNATNQHMDFNIRLHKINDLLLVKKD